MGMRLVMAALFLIGTVNVAAGDQRVRAEVDRNQLAMGENLRLTVTISGEDGSVDTSPITDFKVVSSGSSQNIRIINGTFSRETAYTYLLLPRRTGRLTIPPLPVQSSGSRQLTREIAVQVTEAQQNRADAGAPLFVRAEVSDDTPYLGQQIIYTFRLFRSVRIANARFQPPDFTGFEARELGDQKNYTASVGGRNYQVSEVRYLVQPLEPGTKVIRGAELTVDVIRRNRRSGGFWDDAFPFGRTQLDTRALKAADLTVVTQPLPPYSGDPPFSGLIGRFSLQTRLEPTRIAVGQSTTWTITISGEGNIRDARAPEAALPEVFKVYDDNPEISIDTTESGDRGEKVFKRALVPVQPGQHPIPPLRLVYFDPLKAAYVTATARSPAVTVAPAQDGGQAPTVFRPDSSPEGSRKEAVAFTGHDILPLKTELTALTESVPLSPGVFVVLMLLPWICCIPVFWLLARRERMRVPARLLWQEAGAALRLAREAETDAAFLSRLHRALIAAIRSLSGAPGASLTTTEAEAILGNAGMNSDQIDRATRLLSRIESARFGGTAISAAERESLHEEIRRIFKELK